MLDHLSQTTEVTVDSFCVLRDIVRQTTNNLLIIRRANFQWCPDQEDTEH